LFCGDNCEDKCTVSFFFGSFEVVEEVITIFAGL